MGRIPLKIKGNKRKIRIKKFLFALDNTCECIFLGANRFLRTVALSERGTAIRDWGQQGVSFEDLGGGKSILSDL